MSKKLYYTVYKITNLITKEYYLGKHKQLGKSPDSYFGSGVNLKRSLSLWGRSNFKKEILFYLPSQEEADDKEFSLIEEVLNKDPLCLNTCLEKYGVANGNANSPEAIEKGRKTKYLRHTKEDPSLLDIVSLNKDGLVIWSGEKYNLIVYLYGYENAIKNKKTLTPKLNTNKTWRKGTQWYGYTISSTSII